MADITTSVCERIKASIILNENGCWVWQKRISENGYGQVSINHKSLLAHRVAYQAFVAPLIDGLQIDHLCKNRACVNPEHLEQVTPRENIHRSDAVYKRLRTKRYCPQGHEYSKENTYYRQTKEGGINRSCMTCARENSKRRYRLTHSNVQDGMPLWAQFSARTHCKNGHEYTETNTYLYAGYRKCKACTNHNKMKAYYQRKLTEVA